MIFNLKFCIFLDTPNASKSLKFSAVKPYNPFESIQSKISKNPFEATSENDNCFEQDLGII